VCTIIPRLLVWGLGNFLPRLVSNYDPPNLCLLCNWDYGCEPFHQAIFPLSWPCAWLRYWPCIVCFVMQRPRLWRHILPCSAGFLLACIKRRLGSRRRGRIFLLPVLLFLGVTLFVTFQLKAIVNSGIQASFHTLRTSSLSLWGSSSIQLVAPSEVRTPDPRGHLLSSWGTSSGLAVPQSWYLNPKTMWPSSNFSSDNSNLIPKSESCSYLPLFS
jgi:hypothetical protein